LLLALYMTFLHRYQNGETTEVYSDITRLGKAAFSKEHLTDVEAVVTETMKRVTHNLVTIYDELNRINYNFKPTIRYNFEAPLNKPIAETDKLLDQLEMMVKPVGSVPLSLKLFYKVVGSCNFAWDYETKKNEYWPYSDPIQIAPLDALVQEVQDEYWLDEMTESMNDDGTAYLALSADYLHKDNVSGGPAYAIELPAGPSVDGKLLNEEHQTTLINYLRIVFENCGFGRTRDIEHLVTFSSFRDNVSPKLLRI
jgi:hypothetical protein